MNYVERRFSEYECSEWNIGVKSLKTNTDRICNWGGLEITMLKRSKLKHKLDHGEHVIGVLTDRYDRGMDIPGFDGNSRPKYEDPLIIFYRIWGNSTASEKNKGRKDLWENVKSHVFDPMGIAIYLPRSSREPNNFIGQEFDD